MTAIDRVTYIVNVRTGTVHVAHRGRTVERWNVVQVSHSLIVFLFQPQ